MEHPILEYYMHTYEGEEKVVINAEIVNGTTNPLFHISTMIISKSEESPEVIPEVQQIIDEESEKMLFTFDFMEELVSLRETLTERVRKLATRRPELGIARV